MSQRRKSFKQHREPSSLVDVAAHARLSLPTNVGGTYTVDLSSWLGKGLDLWVFTCVAQLKAFVENKTVALASVAAYGKALRYFFQCLCGDGKPPAPEQLQPSHMVAFVRWLKSESRLGDVSQRNVFTHVKAVLIALQQRGLVQDEPDLFPRNSFSNAARKKQGGAPLSLAERSRVADALRRDIVDLHAERFNGTDGQAMVVYALALAMRTGLNTTPLLELRRDCLQPHPFMPRMRLMRAYKRRGNATHVKALRYQRTTEVPASVPLDGVALFEAALRRTEALTESAPAHLKDRVWLYRSEALVNGGSICCLTEAALSYNVAAFVRRHDLLADDGGPLALNTSRLRKTMENRLWRLSNGDLFTVATLMGHSPAVAEQSYLRVTEDMRRSAAFVGEALPNTYRGSPPLGAERPLEATPVGNCLDTVHGHRAPGNGTRCTDFLSCFGCRSFAIVGSKEDLHRLFSFYWFLEAEGRATRSQEWAEHFLLLRTQIDTFTLDKFDEALVLEAKKTARVRPLTFWSQYTRSGGKIHAVD